VERRKRKGKRRDRCSVRRRSSSLRFQERIKSPGGKKREKTPCVPLEEKTRTRASTRRTPEKTLLEYCVGLRKKPGQKSSPIRKQRNSSPGRASCEMVKRSGIRFRSLSGLAYTLVNKGQPRPTVVKGQFQRFSKAIRCSNLDCPADGY